MDISTTSVVLHARTADDISKHNSAYWKPGASWRGFGLGAASSEEGARFSRPRSMNDYVRSGSQMVRRRARGVSADRCLTLWKMSC